MESKIEILNYIYFNTEYYRNNYNEINYNYNIDNDEYYIIFSYQSMQLDLS